jgi:hypothetical protein
MTFCAISSSMLCLFAVGTWARPQQLQGQTGGAGELGAVYTYDSMYELLQKVYMAHKFLNDFS